MRFRRSRRFRCRAAQNSPRLKLSSFQPQAAARSHERSRKGRVLPGVNDPKAANPSVPPPPPYAIPGWRRPARGASQIIPDWRGFQKIVFNWRGVRSLSILAITRFWQFWQSSLRPSAYVLQPANHPGVRLLFKTKVKTQFDRTVTERSKCFFSVFHGSNAVQFQPSISPNSSFPVFGRQRVANCPTLRDAKTPRLKLSSLSRAAIAGREATDRPSLLIHNRVVFGFS